MNVCVVGLQWGDEGKGKIVDLLSESADLVVRYTGGANAGHTVVRRQGEKPFALHLLPSGILREGILCVIAGGVVVDADTLLSELDGLAERGIAVRDNLRLSNRAHLVMDYHKLQDRLSEDALGDAKIGTTIRGIGPCYADKVLRSAAVRVADLADLDGLRQKLADIVALKNRLLPALYPDAQPLHPALLHEKCRLWADRLKPYITDTTDLLQRAWRQKKRILFEGAQGTLLDLDHGTFPFVTSSNAGPGGLAAVSGLPAQAVDQFLGVTKAYSTRVGSGPLPTEQNNEVGQFIRRRGHEYGTTTGRPRRCGWFDAVAVSYSLQVGGIDAIALQHLDTLSGLQELKICTGYRRRGQPLPFFPAENDVLQEVECEYQTLPGFEQDLAQVRRFDDLPEPARRYVLRLEDVLHVPITLVGVGPSREQTIWRTAGKAL